MRIDTAQIQATQARYAERAKQRDHNVRKIKAERYLEVDRPELWQKYLTRHGFAPRDVAAMLREPRRGLPAAREAVGGRREPFALERVLGAMDLMGVSFLEGGLQAARSVARVWVNVAGGRPAGYGTGFLVSPRLLLTNQHVLEDKASARRSWAEFNYQRGLTGALLSTTTFHLDPDTFFFNDAHLDYALVALRPVAGGAGPGAQFGWTPLIEEEGKAVISQWVNIIQHPGGEPKQLCLRENQVVDRLEDFLHYRTDTAPGSSGAP